VVTIKEMGYWKDKLYDSSKRNKLLNCVLPESGKRISKNSLLISEPGPEQLWTLLNDMKSKVVFNEKGGYISDNTQILFSMMDGPSQAYRILQNLKKRADVILDQKGMNVLYLAVGFLRWKEKNNNDRMLNSPILLIPVRLSSENGSDEIYMSRFDDEIVVNAALRARLMNAGIDMPELVKGMSFAEYLLQLVSAVEHTGWSVYTGNSQLSLFAVFKADMHNDLCSSENKLSENTVIKAMNQDISFDSDVSDMIVLEENGVSFVLDDNDAEQRNNRIARIITTAVSKNKKVLMLSENTESLEKVFDEIRIIDSARSCLKLYGRNTEREAFISQFEPRQNNPWRGSQVKCIDENTQKMFRTCASRVIPFSQAADVAFEEAAQIFGETGIEHSVSGAREMIELLDNCMKSPGIPKYLMDANVDERLSAIRVLTDDVRYYTNTYERVAEYGTRLRELIVRNVAVTVSSEHHEYYRRRSEYQNMFQYFMERLKPDQRGTFTGHDKVFHNHLLLCQKLNDECTAMQLYDKDNSEKLNMLIEASQTVKQNCDSLYRDLKSIEAAVTSSFDSRILYIDTEQMIVRYKENHHSSLRFLNNEFNNDKKLFSEYYHGSTKLTHQLIGEIAEYIAQYQKLSVKYNEQTAVLSQITASRKQLEAAVNENRNNLGSHQLLQMAELRKLEDMQRYYVSDIDSMVIYYNDKKNSLSADLMTKKKNLMNFLNVKDTGDQAFDDMISRIKWVSGLKSQLAEYRISGKEIIDKICRRDRDTVMKLGSLLTKLKNCVNEISRAVEKCMDLFSYNHQKLIEYMSFTEVRNIFIGCRDHFDDLYKISLYNRLRSEAFENDKYAVTLMKEEMDRILEYKSCILTSPLMVSRYFSESDIEFDTVVFYQSSQLRIRDAICSVLRARQMVAAADGGDNMPADFFASHTADSDNDRSLLDEADKLPVVH